MRVAHADGRDEAMTFRELSEWSSRFAHWLAARGVAPGDRVAIMLEPSLAFYAALFGAIKRGAIAVPLFTLFGPDGVRLRVDDCAPRLLLTNAEKADDGARPSGPRRGRGRRRPAGRAGALSRAAARRGARPDDLAVFQYTSGTTRELPAAVRHTHRAIVVLMVAALYGTGIRPGDRFFCPSSPAWGHGLWHGTLAPLALGVTTGTMAGKFDPVRMLRALEDYGVTNAVRGGDALPHDEDLGRGRRATAHAIRKLSFTGEPMDSATRDFVEATFGVPVCSMYGTTEVGVHPRRLSRARRTTPSSPARSASPCPGVRVEVQRPDGRALPRPDELGEIKVWRRGEWFATKDRGHVDEDGLLLPRGPRRRRDHLRRLDDERGRDRGRAAQAPRRPGGGRDRRARRRCAARSSRRSS